MRAFLSSIWRLDPSQRPTYEELHRAAEGDPEALQLYGGGTTFCTGRQQRSPAAATQSNLNGTTAS